MSEIITSIHNQEDLSSRLQMEIWQEIKMRFSSCFKEQTGSRGRVRIEKIYDVLLGLGSLDTLNNTATTAQDRPENPSLKLSNLSETVLEVLDELSGDNPTRFLFLHRQLTQLLQTGSLPFREKRLLEKSLRNSIVQDAITDAIEDTHEIARSNNQQAIIKKIKSPTKPRQLRKDSLSDPLNCEIDTAFNIFADFLSSSSMGSPAALMNEKQYYLGKNENKKEHTAYSLNNEGRELAAELMEGLRTHAANREELGAKIQYLKAIVKNVEQDLNASSSIDDKHKIEFMKLLIKSCEARLRHDELQVAHYQSDAATEQYSPWYKLVQAVSGPKEKLNQPLACYAIAESANKWRQPLLEQLKQTHPDTSIDLIDEAVLFAEQTFVPQILEQKIAQYRTSVPISETVQAVYRDLETNAAEVQVEIDKYLTEHQQKLRDVPARIIEKALEKITSLSQSKAVKIALPSAVGIATALGLGIAMDKTAEQQPVETRGYKEGDSHLELAETPNHLSEESPTFFGESTLRYTDTVETQPLLPPEIFTYTFETRLKGTASVIGKINQRLEDQDYSPIDWQNIQILFTTDENETMVLNTKSLAEFRDTLISLGVYPELVNEWLDEYEHALQQPDFYWPFNAYDRQVKEITIERGADQFGQSCKLSTVTNIINNLLQEAGSTQALIPRGTYLHPMTVGSLLEGLKTDDHGESAKGLVRTVNAQLNLSAPVLYELFGLISESNNKELREIFGPPSGNRDRFNAPISERLMEDRTRQGRLEIAIEIYQLFSDELKQGKKTILSLPVNDSWHALEIAGFAIQIGSDYISDIEEIETIIKNNPELITNFLLIAGETNGGYIGWDQFLGNAYTSHQGAILLNIMDIDILNSIYKAVDAGSEFRSIWVYDENNPHDKEILFSQLEQKIQIPAITHSRPTVKAEFVPVNPDDVTGPRVAIASTQRSTTRTTSGDLTIPLETRTQLAQQIQEKVDVPRQQARVNRLRRELTKLQNSRADSEQSEQSEQIENLEQQIDLAESVLNQHG